MEQHTSKDKQYGKGFNNLNQMDSPFIALLLDIIYLFPLQAVHKLISSTFQPVSSETDNLQNGGNHMEF